MISSFGRILVVDDDAPFALTISDILSKIGYETVAVSDPAAALEALKGDHFSAALLDRVMPKMGGLDLADRIKEASPDTQVLILTGQADMESAIEGIHRGVFDYIPKTSLNIAHLERALGRAVERSSLVRQNRDLVGRLAESNRRLKALHDIGAVLAADVHLDRQLQSIVAAAKAISGAATGRALLLGRLEPEGLIVEVAVGDGGAVLQGARLQPGEGIAPLVMERDEPLIVERPRDHPRYSHRCDQMPAGSGGLLCAPLRQGTVHGALMVAGREKGSFEPEDRDALTALARHAAAAIENAFARERAINFFTHTMDILISILDRVDSFQAGHSRRVAALVNMVARRLGMAEAERRTVHFAALLHDIGKIQLDPALLKCAKPAFEEGRHLVEQHPLLGVQLLKPITLWEDILPIIHAHHERWDGKGYPRGLAEEQIPMGARIVAVADAFDAMTRGLLHGPPRSAEEALNELEAHGGSQFDPRIVRMFVAEYRERGGQVDR